MAPPALGMCSATVAPLPVGCGYGSIVGKMPSKKVTFTLDESTVSRLRRTARRLHKPQSLVVREAIADYAARADRLGDEECERLLEHFDRLVPEIPRLPAADARAEKEALRAARRAGGRRPLAESED